MHWLPAILILPYLFLLFKIYRNLIKLKVFNVSYDPLTFVSVVVACRNEQNNINHLLESIASQDYPKELFEVIIVDDNSTDRTFESVSHFKGISNLITIKNNGSGKKEAIFTGIQISSGHLIITTDADCTMRSGWIRTIASFYETHRPEMIICPVQLESGKGFFRKFQEIEFLALQGITAGSALSSQATMCNGANLAFTRETYLKNVGNLHFEIASGDDIFLLHSLKARVRRKFSGDCVITYRIIVS